jgi:CRP/FNR family transcriptional regulator, cyclic AMP receptor protein
VAYEAPNIPPDPGGATTSLAAPFDPRFLLSKLGSGKSRQEYPTDQAVFAQGDAANAVFYIQAGKVKLTVVSKVGKISKVGKEAVIAILPEDSFFGEGCLAGQPVRMATASTLQWSVIVRMRSLSC